jgi:uncharacterized membrane protein
MRVRSGEVFYMAILMIIILLAMFILVALAMMISADQSMVTERKGAIFQLVDQMIQGMGPLMVALAETTGFFIDQFWKLIPV